MSPGDTPGRNALGMSRSTLFAAPTLIATGAHIRLLQALTAMPTGLRAVPSSTEHDSSERNEPPPPSTGKPNRRFVCCKNGAEASLLEARHSNGRHSAQFEMHCLRFCVFSACTRTQCAYGPRTARWHRSRRSNRCRSGTSLEPRRTLCSHPSRSGRAHCTPGGSCWGSAPAVQDEKQKAA